GLLPPGRKLVGSRPLPVGRARRRRDGARRREWLPRRHARAQRPLRGASGGGARGGRERRRQDREGRTTDLVGRLWRLLRRPGRIPLGGSDGRDEPSFL